MNGRRDRFDRYWIRDNPVLSWLAVLAILFLGPLIFAVVLSLLGWLNPLPIVW